ncbi:FtsW/RodA/SpoVE family cell cycle protein [Anaerocolumna sp. MB42-C2]|uniref:FtsW/RodA/SpoVE family cell cycle protein n=1 Tax=Anaerocolumna sp. MB42-C2 TaxID=3070997 RepID=UPI0027DF48EC|nr:FtsW/RodA/SpoVE family cell cycle protein [Anaerocolumna sp. MB42-C2]WMJ87944.1 FtsW/RodA/SpoVE family cell cycle protein [Anaerocolumna sp. MB42-C2]
MVNIIIEFSKYLNIILIAIYTYYAFRVFGFSDKKKQNKTYRKMSYIIFSFHFICYLILYLTTKNVKVVFLYGLELIALILVLTLYQWIYVNLSKQILHNMLFLLTIGFVMLTRLSYDKAIKQFMIASATLVICLIIPLLIDKMKYLSRLGWVYGIVGIVMLLSVLLWGVENYGATNWIRIAGFTFQPSEFVKILFVFGIASLLSKRTDFRYIVCVTALAACHVLILVLEKDLGGALIFFITYLVMLFVATSEPLYFFSGLLAGCAASYLAYHQFYHVRVRVMVWRDPWSLIDNEGYQVSQSLFAIGTGGWFGMGLFKGLPTSIPVVDSDFIFSAISEEMGGLFAVCLILICISSFIMFINIAMKLNNTFYKLIALGLSIIYIFQVFLSVGGVTKFIPSTGVTFPLISYGGSSILSSIIMFSVIQGLYVLGQDRNDNIEKRKSKKKNTTE